VKGFVETPVEIVDHMVERLFKDKRPTPSSRLLDPGCGHGVLLKGVLRWCQRNRSPIPSIVGIDSDSEKLRIATREIDPNDRVSFLNADFLAHDIGTFDYIIGNPPYVAIGELSQAELTCYRKCFETARGRIDLYLLFWERALRILRPSGRTVFITPEKFTYVETARPLRRLMSRFHIEELFYTPEDTFPGFTTYPVITVLSNSEPQRETSIRTRVGTQDSVRLPGTGDSWQPTINKSPVLPGTRTLADVSLRISCGVATGADKAFLFNRNELHPELASFARPTIGGRELRSGEPLSPSRYLLLPYDETGKLLPRDQLGAAGTYLEQEHIRERLEARTCVRRKPWYAFHETPPLEDLLRPKILCKDIAKRPYFWIDREGTIVPLHSTYYIVPAASESLDAIAAYLNSSDAVNWLVANCQRAANEFIRIQSSVLKRLPVPDELADSSGMHSLAA
jgi:adenine-specific DNA-methyltransferase